MQFRPTIILVSFLVLIGFLAYRFELAFPGRPPSLYNTYTPLTKSAPDAVGSYDLLGYVVDKTAAEQLLQTETGRAQLAAENGAVAVTEELINLGRDAFYLETFGNEYLFTDVVGILDGSINLGSLTKAILALGGQPTTNLQISLDREMKVGDRTYAAGTTLNTGLDVPGGSLVPLGIRTFINDAHVRVGVTCALCHAAVNPATGRVLEGAPNTDVDTGLLLAFASNSATLFCQSSVNPTEIPLGQRAIAANQANESLQRVNVEGIGHAYWVDRQAGFTIQDQTDLIKFLLSIDDDPEVLPN